MARSIAAFTPKHYALVTILLFSRLAQLYSRADAGAFFGDADARLDNV